jgi:hypothetical protein
MRSDKTRALNAYASQLRSLIRQLDDARALTWSTDFSDSLGRSQTEIKSLIPAIELEVKGVPPGRVSLRAPLADSLAHELAPHVEADWPYLAL